jgi:hypothetical protein
MVSFHLGARAVIYHDIDAGAGIDTYMRGARRWGKKRLGNATGKAEEVAT